MDEPGNGLHPDMIKTVADAIRHASAHCQLIVATHSPLLLNCFELDDILVFEKKVSICSNAYGMPIADDNKLAGKVVTDIPHPSDVISVLLGRYFEKVVAGRKRKVKYGKLKTAPALLDLLDAGLLRHQDEELGMFADGCLAMCDD